MEITLTPEYIDPTYSHVHHAKICEILEQSRIEFFRTHGLSVDQMIEEGILPVLAFLSLTFLRELKVGNYHVECRDPKASDKEFRTHQVILNEKRKVCVAADVVIKFLYKDRKRSGVFPHREKLKF